MKDEKKCTCGRETFTGKASVKSFKLEPFLPLDKPSHFFTSPKEPIGEIRPHRVTLGGDEYWKKVEHDNKRFFDKIKPKQLCVICGEEIELGYYHAVEHQLSKHKDDFTEWEQAMMDNILKQLDKNVGRTNRNGEYPTD